MADTKRRNEEWTDEHADALIAEVERIAWATNYLIRDDTGHMVAHRSKLSAAVKERGSLNGVWARSEPKPATMRALGRWAAEQRVPGYEGPQPYLRLFRICGWLDHEEMPDDALNALPDPMRSVLAQMADASEATQWAMVDMLRAAREMQR